MMTRWTLALVLSCALFACNDRESQSGNAVAATDAATPAVSAQELTPEQLGELGAKITKNASQAKEILREQGLDEKTFEAKIRKVTEDPEASKRYAAAFEKAKA